MEYPPQTVPQPLQIDLEFTFETQIRVIMTEMVDDAETGGSPITSYALDWDKGSFGNEWHSYTGTLDDNLKLTIDFTDLTKGNYYRFKYRVKNIYGWSAYTDYIE